MIEIAPHTFIDADPAKLREEYLARDDHTCMIPGCQNEGYKWGMANVPPLGQIPFYVCTDHGTLKPLNTPLFDRIIAS